MIDKVVLDMLVAFTLIVIIIVFGGTRIFVRRKYNVREHFAEIDEAVKRNQLQQRKLHHNVTVK